MVPTTTQTLVIKVILQWLALILLSSIVVLFALNLVTTLVPVRRKLRLSPLLR